MNATDRGKNILLDAECLLKQLIAEAAQEGDYQSIAIVASWASALKEVRSNGRIMADAHVSASPSSVCRQTEKKKRNRRKTKGTTRSKGKGGTYPKFTKSGDTLVKIAWSKSQKSEYKHKSPRSVLNTLVDAIDHMLGENSLLAMENVLPLSSADGQEIPDYQVYLCLAWLRSIGVVEQKGRQGYTRNGVTGNLKTVVDKEWNSLLEDV